MRLKKSRLLPIRALACRQPSPSIADLSATGSVIHDFRQRIPANPVNPSVRSSARCPAGKNLSQTIDFGIV
jgi:hypothetical protein